MPAAQDLVTLQVGDAPDAKFFQAAASQGHYKNGGPYGTQQGAYVIAPSGVLLGSTTLRGAEDVATVLRSALEKWRAMPREKRLRADDVDASRGSVRREPRPYPGDGMVLELFSRDLPDELHQQPWNQDHVWFTASEVAAVVPEARPGARASWPEPLARRLAMLHFIDVTHGLRFGEPPYYASGDEVRASLSSVVESVDGARVKLRIEGSTHTKKSKSPARGVDTRVLGHATWDASAHRFIAFEAVALGTRWGANWLGDRNDRASEAGPQSIGFSLSLAGTAPHDRVPPEYLAEYDACR